MHRQSEHAIKQEKDCASSTKNRWTKAGQALRPKSLLVIRLVGPQRPTRSRHLGGLAGTALLQQTSAGVI
jgi:hypothetical protein